MSAEKSKVVAPCVHRSPVRSAAHEARLPDNHISDVVAPCLHRSSAQIVHVGKDKCEVVAPIAYRSSAPSAAHVGADKNQAAVRSVHCSSARSAAHEAPPPGTHINEVVAPGLDRSSARTAHVGTAKLDMAVRREEAKAALVGLGWKSTIAGNAVTQAMATAGPETTLEELIRLALRLCPRPSVA